MLRLIWVLSFSLLAMCVQATAASASDEDFGLSTACKHGNGTDTPACYKACKRAKQADADLSVWGTSICEDAIMNTEAKALVKDKVCNASKCLVKLKMTNNWTKTGPNIYAGQGYRIVITYENEGDPGSITGQMTYAAIKAPTGGTTKLAMDCAGDGSCEAWEWKSGPLKEARIDFQPNSTNLILTLPK